MSGETEEHVSGWTTDTLHSHVLQLVGANASVIKANQAECETRVNAVEHHLQKQITDLQTQIDRRFDREAMAVRLAFDTHKENTKEALVAAETAIQAALVGAEKAVQTALASAEKAVDKAEIANEKRFASVNEFRAQLSDQVATFISRNEAEVRFLSLNDKINTQQERTTVALQPVIEYIAKDQGKGAGMDKLWGIAVGGIGLMISLIAIVWAFAHGGN